MRFMYRVAVTTWSTLLSVFLPVNYDCNVLLPKCYPCKATNHIACSLALSAHLFHPDDYSTLVRPRELWQHHTE